MLKQLLRQINTISSFGIKSQDFYIDKFRKRVLNNTFFIVGCCCFLLVIEAIILGNQHDNIVPLSIGLISFGSLGLSYLNKFDLARLVLTALFPTIFFVAIILYGEQLKLEYTLSLFLVLALTMYDSKWIRLLNISYLIIIQIISFYYTFNYPSIYAEYVDFLDSIIILTFTTLGLFVLVSQYIRGNKRFQAKQKQLNIVLDKKNKALEESITEKVLLNKELLEKTEDLQRSNDFLESYTYIASHDLKTPLRNISSFSELLHKKLKQAKDEEIKDYLKFIKTGVFQVNAIVEGIIENAQSNSSSLQWEEVNCLDIMEKIRAKKQFLLESIQGQFLFQELPIIQADSLMLTKVFSNLVDNGFKYNKSTSPTVKISYLETLDHHEFSVTDNGIGIQAAYRDDIFKMFKQLQSTQDFSGVGVGLALCKKIIELHRGQIWLDTGNQAGSTFKFTIPKQMSH